MSDWIDDLTLIALSRTGFRLQLLKYQTSSIANLWNKHYCVRHVHNRSFLLQHVLSDATSEHLLQYIFYSKTYEPDTDYSVLLSPACSLFGTRFEFRHGNLRILIWVFLIWLYRRGAEICKKIIEILPWFSSVFLEAVGHVSAVPTSTVKIPIFEPGKWKLKNIFCRKRKIWQWNRISRDSCCPHFYTDCSTQSK